MSTSIPTSARVVVLQNHPLADQDVDLSSSPSGTFTVKEIPFPNPVPEDSLLVQTLYLSNDTGIRLFIEKSVKYEDDIPTLPLGSPIPVFRSIVRVIQVGGGDAAGSFKPGDIIEMWQSQWADYVVVKKDKARPIKQRPGISLSAHLGTIGSSGASAYWALIDVLKTKQTGTIVVSGASGAVGNVAIQYAKHVMGVKNVVGIAGSDEKCKWLKSVGADEAVNYKSSTFVEDLRKATLEGVDSFLDNVGGTILDEVMMRMKPHGIICAMGFMARVKNIDEPIVMRNYVQIFVRKLTLHGFSLSDYYDRQDEAEEALASAVAAGKLILDGAETVVDIHGHIEEIPRVWDRLFTGTHSGKLVTKVAD